MTINVTNTVGANNTIVFDSNSKIPAIDGSQVTALSATAFTTGSLATARIDVGTTAGKILQLDGNAKIPAISGANLTNAPGPTVSTSDPAIDTNSTLGTKWINKTSGEVYICIDATTGANVWTNVGAGSGDITPWTYPGESYGYCAGGNAPGPTSNVIDKFSFTSQANATDVGDLTASGGSHCPNTSPTHGYCSGGAGLGANIDKWSFASGGNAVDAGFNLSASRIFGAGGSSSTNGYCLAGSSGGPVVNTLDKFAFATSSNASDIGNATQSRERLASHSSETHGYGSGGSAAGASSPFYNIIEKYSFSSDGNATDVGNLTQSRSPDNGGASSATDGHTVGGYQGGSSNVIDEFSFSSDGDSTDVGDLVSAVRHGMCSSSTGYGYFSGGYPSTNTIQRWSFTSSGNSVDWADLTQARLQGSGNQS
tara:strand:+ start:278 stop:1552 length:1275 start_codon:yes stop_codon:yes gene_type:complete